MATGLLSAQNTQPNSAWRNWRVWAAVAGAGVVIIVVAAVYGHFSSGGSSSPAAEIRTPQAPVGQRASQILQPATARAATNTRPPAPAATLPQPAPGTQTRSALTATASAAPATSPATSPIPPTTPAAPTAPAGTPPPGPLPQDLAAVVAEAQQSEAKGELLQARVLYSQALAKAADPAQRAAIVRQAAPVGEKTLLAPRVWTGDTDVEQYEIQSGDVLANIGARYRIPYELIKRVNNLSSDTIRAGDKLKVIKGPFRARIIKSQFRLELWLRDAPVKVFPVAIGLNDSTPAGQYAVKLKQKNPTFYPPPALQGKMGIKQAGDPENPLGARWIDLGNHLGIHGTNEPQSIGKSVSLGCIRMHNADVELLYDCLIPGSAVEIAD